VKARFERVVPYAGDALSLPVPSVDRSVRYYVERFGFHVVSRTETPIRSAILERDKVRIGLAENGGDPTQNGAYFQVDDIEAAFEELRGSRPAPGDLREDKTGGTAKRVFFEVAPDGLCFMLGQPLT
jgi:catechol 2,3-dioxygenase-like lactoylglutathione lyase family enzyme